MDELRCSIEVRADDSIASPGRLFGVLLTYGERAGDRAEVFEPGSLEWDPAGSSFGGNITAGRQSCASFPKCETGRW